MKVKLVTDDLITINLNCLVRYSDNFQWSYSQQIENITWHK
ncbi:hypothetical protein ACP6PL_11505 [Dapis sp. BLCC M126]